MPANTPTGLPYPLPTEPVAEGAQAIRNLAEAVDPAMRRIATAVAAGTVIDFPNIPQTFTSLRLVASLSSTGGMQTVAIRFNGDATGNYSCQRIKAIGTSLAASENPGTIGFLAGCSSGAAGPLILDAVNYREPASHTRAAMWQFGTISGAVGATTVHELWTGFGAWGNSVPVTRITLTILAAAFGTASRATLYGIP